MKVVTALSLLLLASVAGLSQVQQGFDFRNTQNAAPDPPGSTYVLASTAYPTTVGGMTFGWANTYFVQGRDRNGNNNNLDPRLAGVNLVTNGSPATFYVDLPAPGTYSLSLAMGDAGYEECWSQCQIQFLDGNTVLATVAGGDTRLGYFYDAAGNNWSATDWPVRNVSQQVTLTGTRLTVVVGTNKATGDFTPIAFLGISGGTETGFQFLPSLVVAPGQQGSMVLTFTAHSGFNSPIALSVGTVPPGVTVTLDPVTIPAPGSGSSTMTVTLAQNAALGTFPIAVSGIGGGMNGAITVALTVKQ
jgi:hypothetical protein